MATVFIPSLMQKLTDGETTVAVEGQSVREIINNLDKLMRTQHLIGASRWRKISENQIQGVHQMRSRSSRSADTESGAAAVDIERCTVVEHMYVKVESQWQLGGIKPSLR